MELDATICYRALRSRDARFDGRFFTGVTSTGIYCRPVCPARTPRVENCRFFACAAAAEEAGFRPCRRCRPETAPGTPAWQGSASTVSRALRLIDDGALDDEGHGVENLAERLGVGGRHLRRLFAEQLGASPLAVAQTRRAHLARRLIEVSSLPMTRIALAAGFPNVRRFNASIRERFQCSPSEIRRGARRAAGRELQLRLAFRPPLDWSALLAYLAPRAIPGVERVDGDSYSRTVAQGDFAGVVRVSLAPGGGALVLSAPPSAAAVLAALASRARSLFDLDADPAAIGSVLAADPVLAPLLAQHPGLRAPGAWDRFELAIRALLGQQISVAAATRLAGRLVRRWGRPLDARTSAPEAVASREPAWLFPRPQDLADADIASLGMPGARADAIRGFASAVASGAPLLELAASSQQAVDRLTALDGVGDWTAQYIALRALKEPDAFPAGDLGLRRALPALAPGGEQHPLPTAAALRRRAEGWRPWRGYAAMLLWQSDLPGPPRQRERN
ncbi:DNA-3-methyladenine glycosylase 2 family protein [bacterium]|nr:DNA-3-methyladenine glycosylase 2 family protein [bacterium]